MAFTIIKADKAQQIVYGWGSVSLLADGASEDGASLVTDLQGDQIEPDELQRAVEEFVLESRQSGVMHEGATIGYIVASLVTTPDIVAAFGLGDKVPVGWIIGVKVADPAAWKRVESGELKAFSIQGSADRIPVEGGEPAIAKSVADPPWLIQERLRKNWPTLKDKDEHGYGSDPKGGGSSGGGSKDPKTLTAGQINRELDKLDAVDSKIAQDMIDAGRGLEKPTETRTKDDPLSRRFQAAADRRGALRNEIEARYGPNAPYRLPSRGFGPIRSVGKDKDEHGYGSDPKGTGSGSSTPSPREAKRTVRAIFDRVLGGRGRKVNIDHLRLLNKDDLATVRSAFAAGAGSQYALANVDREIERRKG